MRGAAVVLTFMLAVCGVLATTVPVSARGGDEPPSPGTVRSAGLDLMVQQDGEWWGVAIHMLVVDPADGSFEQRAEEARAAILARFPGAIVVPDGGVSAQSVRAGYYWPGSTANWNYNPAGKPSYLTDDAAVMSAAAAAWNNAGSANWRWGPSGTISSEATGGCSNTRDGKNTVGWRTQSGSTLAVTCAWYRGTGDPHPASEFDMEIDPDYDWSTVDTNPRYDLRSVITHEFGHAVGLDHTQAANCPGTVMCAQYRRGTLLRTPQADDLAGLIGLYGKTEGPPPVPPSEPPKSTTPATGAQAQAPTATPTPSITPGPPPQPAPQVQRPFHVVAAAIARN